MKIQRAMKRKMFGYEPGKGFIVFGYPPDSRRWFERWFPSIKAAKKYCNKRNWQIEDA